MAIEAHIRELGSRHQMLEKAIEDERRAPSSDSLKVHELKRRKLKLKEQIEGLRDAQPH